MNFLLCIMDSFSKISHFLTENFRNLLMDLDSQFLISRTSTSERVRMEHSPLRWSMHSLTLLVMTAMIACELEIE